MKYRIRYQHIHETHKDGRPVVRMINLPISGRVIEYIGITYCHVDRWHEEGEGDNKVKGWREVAEGRAICLRGDNFCKAEGRERSFKKALARVEPRQIRGSINALYNSKAKSVEVPE